jgi:hypothetical protein
VDHNDQNKERNTAEGGRQTDLAEGELDTVEESIRVHEQKGDLRPESSPEKGGKREPRKNSE